MAFFQVAQQERDIRLRGGVKGVDGLLIMRAGASYYYESARTLLASFYV